MRQRERAAAQKRAEKLISEGMTVVEVLRDFNQRRYLSRDWTHQEVEELCGGAGLTTTPAGRVQALEALWDGLPRIELEQVRHELVRFKDNPPLANRMALTLIDHYLDAEPSK